MSKVFCEKAEDPGQLDGMPVSEARELRDVFWDVP